MPGVRSPRALVRVVWIGANLLEQVSVQANPPIGRYLNERDRKRRADHVVKLEPGLTLMIGEARRLWSVPRKRPSAPCPICLDAPLALSTMAPVALQRHHGCAGDGAG